MRIVVCAKEVMDPDAVNNYALAGRLEIGEDGRTITQECSYDDPVRGPLTWRSVTRIVDDHTHLFEMFATIQGGKEERMMEITYTRKS